MNKNSRDVEESLDLETTVLPTIVTARSQSTVGNGLDPGWKRDHRG